MKIRKQVYDLTTHDLAKHPIWEFALDEEGEEGQDEATVRPLMETEREAFDPMEGMYVVGARFTLADGGVHVGYLTPCEDPEDMGTIQPQIVTEKGQVGFWLGLASVNLEESYAKLGKSAEATFPVKFVSDIELFGAKLAGVIPAFLKLKDFETMKVEYLK
jgi:hypothetical protein